MSNYRGRVDGIYARRLIGWVLDLDAPHKKLKVVVIIDGRVAASLTADQPRADLVARGIGDGANAFVFDLTHVLSHCGPEAEIEVIAGTAGWVVPGSPLRLEAAAAGVIDAWEDGELVGWAHGPRYSRTRIEVLRADEVLLAWPCDMLRRDLAALAIGDGRFGFRIPLAHLLGGRDDDLVFRIEGTGNVLRAAGHTMRTRRDLPDRLPAPRFASASEARRALVRALTQSADGASGRAKALLSFDAFQNLLNALSRAESRLADERKRLAFLAQRMCEAEGREAAASLAGGELVDELGRLSALSSMMKSAALVGEVERRLVPSYARSPAARPAFERALGRSRNTKLLKAVTKAFRKSDFLAAPSIAYATSLRHAQAVTSDDIRYLRNVQSWVDCRRLERHYASTDAIARVNPLGPRSLYVLWRCVPYDTNGYATRSHYLLRAFQQIGAEAVGVTRLGYPWDAEQRKSPRALREIIDGVAYLHLGGPEASRLTMGLDAYIGECAERIAQVAAALGADLIHSASNWMAGLPALMAARLVGLPFAYEIRGLWEITRASNVPGYDQTDHYALFKEMEALTAREADLVFTITRQVRDEMASRGVAPGKMRLAPNGVEVGRFQPMAKDQGLKQELGIGDEVVFGFVGSFAKYEGLADLCRAALEVSRRGLNFKLLLVGDGPVFEEVEAFCNDHRLTGRRVIITGRVPFTDVPRYYSLIDVAVFPRSSVEITEMVSPLKPFEAMAMAKPVIGSSVAAIADIVRHGHTGWLFRKGDLSALVDVLCEVINGRERIPGLGLAARRFVEEHHDWSVIARLIAEGWQELRTRWRDADRGPRRLGGAATGKVGWDLPQ